MIKIIVASKNPVKINAVKIGFESMMKDKLEVDGVSVPSGVSDQPLTDDETRIGSENRANNAKSTQPDADYWVGIEGGIDKLNGTLQTFGWITILSKKKQGQSRSATIPLPVEVEEGLKNGEELGDIQDRLFHKDNSKQNMGTSGILTNGVLDRLELYRHAMILALVPFVNEY